MGQTQEPAPYSRTVRIGIITVVAKEEEEEDIMMESNGEGDNGQYEYTEYIQADDDDSADDLDEYYRELGIDPEEMKPASSKKKSSAPSGEYVVREKKETTE